MGHDRRVGLDAAINLSLRFLWNGAQHVGIARQQPSAVLIPEDREGMALLPIAAS